MDELANLFLVIENYMALEDLLLRVFSNHNLPNQRRHDAIIRVFNFPDYAKPQTKLNLQLLKEINTLNPDSPENARLISLYLKTFDKKPKFTFYENRLEDIPAYKAEMIDFHNLASMTFMQRDYT